MSLALFNELAVIRPKPNGDSNGTVDEKAIQENYPIISVAYWKFKGTVDELAKQGDISKIYWVKRENGIGDLGDLYQWSGFKIDKKTGKGVHTWVKYKEKSDGYKESVLNHEAYQYKSGSYLYDLRNIAVFLYGLKEKATSSLNLINPQFGVPKVSENFWQIIDLTKSVTLDDEYFNFDRLSVREPLTMEEYGKKELYDPTKDSTVLKCYAALKKAVAMAGFYCTALPLSPYQSGMRTQFLHFYERAISNSGDGNFDPTQSGSWKENQLDTLNKDDYGKNIPNDFKYFEPYTINPTTHIVELGKKPYLVRDKIRDLYNRAERITIQRPLINFGQEETTNSDFEDTDSNRFTQCLAKINAAYDFNIPVIELDMGEKKDYIFNKFTLEWEEIEVNYDPCASFDSNGGTAVAPIYEKEGTVISLTDEITPTRNGYSFSYWKAEVENEEGEIIEFKISAKDTYTMTSNDIEFEAVWEVKEYTIKFDLDGGTAETGQWTPITEKYGTDITKEWSNPTKKGSTQTTLMFAGWKPELPSTMPAENLTCVAQWENIKYILNFNTDGGNVITAQSYDYNEEIKLPSNPTRTGYTFDGWEWPNGTALTKMPAYNITIAAKWNINTHKIELCYPVESGIGTTTINGVKYNEDISENLTPTEWSHHKFIGWYNESNYETAFNEKTMPDRNLTLYAKFEVCTYTITFSNPTLESISGSYGADISEQKEEHNNPTIPGYEFLGWKKLTETGALEDYSIPSTMPGENLVLVGNSRPYIGVFTFMVDDKAEKTLVKIQKGIILEEEAPQPSKEGYDFDKWEYTQIETPSTTPTTEFPLPCAIGDAGESGYTVIPSLTMDTTFIINANFNKQKYNLTFDKTSCGLEEDIKYTDVEFDSVIELPEIAITGYQLKGWYYLKGNEEISVEFGTEGKVPAFDSKEVKIFAKTEKKQYTLHFETNWDSYYMQDVSVPYDTTYSLPEFKKEREGYTFDGWYSDEGCTIRCDSSSKMPANNLTIYAKWTKLTAT